jgi:hypothetical protein
MGEPAWSGE